MLQLAGVRPRQRFPERHAEHGVLADARKLPCCPVGLKDMQSIVRTPMNRTI
jgi:hypothetical protein